MSLIVYKKVDDNFLLEVSTKAKDPIKLSAALIFRIFSDLNIVSLAAACCVSKEWRRLASNPVPWKEVIYKEIAFGNDKWARCFGADVVEGEDHKEEFSSLPWREFI